MPALDRQEISWKLRLELYFLSLPVSLLLALGSTLSGVIAGTAHGTAKTFFVCSAGLFGTVSGLSAWLANRRSGGYREYASRLARSVTGAGQPVIIALGELCLARTAVTRAEKLVLLEERVLETARRMCGVEDASLTRAVFYRLDTAGETLHRPKWTGRSDGPRPEFRITDLLNGRAIVEFAKCVTPDRMDLVTDVRNEAIRGQVDHRRVTYCSYVSVPVAVGNSSYGLLSIDSPVPSAFTETDGGTLLLLAGVLAAGLAQQSSAGTHG